MKFWLLFNTACALNGICKRKKASGARCRKNIECSSGLCYEDACVWLPGEGEICGPHLICGPGLGCNMYGQCVKMARKGTSCLFTMAGKTLCDIGLLCYNGICDTPRGIGTFCADHDKCGSNLHCFNGLCVSKAKKGHGCYHSLDCEKTLYCDYKLHECVKKSGRGGKCLSNGHCEDHLACLSNTDFFTSLFIPQNCQILPVENERCFERCDPAYYCDVSQ
jgi:hypothetical protein